MLPVEVLGLIFGYLPPKDFLQVQIVCKAWNNATLLCTENWRCCCKSLGMSTHNRFFLFSFGTHCSWRDAYYNCKRQVKQLNNYQEFTVVNLAHKFVEIPRELKFIAPHIFVSNVDRKVESWEVSCFGPSFHRGINKTWSIQKDQQERLVAVNDSCIYLLTLTKPLTLSMRTISTVSSETVATYTTFFPTSHESQPLQFSSYRSDYTIKKCQHCECFIMCSHFLDVTSHSTVLYFVYLCEGKIRCIPHNLTIPNNRENHDSCVIDKMDIISNSQNYNIGICEQHILLTQCSYLIAKFVIQNDGPPKVCLPTVDMPMRAEIVSPEIDLAGVSPKDPIPCYCLSHCSKYWLVCDSNSKMFIYDLSTMTLVKTVKTDVCTDFIIQTIQFSMLYVLVCCCSRSDPNYVCYLLIYVGPGPDSGKTVRKSLTADFFEFPRSVLFVQLEKTKFYQYPKGETAMTYFPDNSLLFHLPSWCL